MYYLRLLLAFSLAILTVLTWGRAGYLLWQQSFSISWLFQVLAHTLASAIVAFSLYYALIKFETIRFPEIGTWFDQPERPEGAAEVVCTFVLFMIVILILVGWHSNPSQYFAWAWYPYCGLMVIAAIQAEQQKKLYWSWVQQDWTEQKRRNPPEFSERSSLFFYDHTGSFPRSHRAAPFYVPPPYVDDRGPDGKPVSPSAQ